MDEKRCPKCGHDLCQPVKTVALFDPPDPALILPFQTPNFIDAWERWKAYRREIRKALTLSSIKAQFRALKPLGEERAIACLELSIQNQWTGIFPDKVKPGGGFKTRGEAEVDYFARTVSEALGGTT